MPVRPRVLALILAGGAGSRLEALTAQRAKPALPYGGSYRLIDFPLSHCVHSGIPDVWVLEQFRPHALNDHLLNGRPWDLDRNSGGLRILPPSAGHDREGFAEGNADALWRNAPFIREFAPDVLLVLSADHVYRLDYRDVLDAHQEGGATVTMVTTEVPLARASRFGTADVAPGGLVRDFAYKPERPRWGTVTTEVFAYDAPRLLARLEALADEIPDDAEGGLRDFGHTLLPALVRDGEARAFPLDGYWRDVGTIESYWAGHMELCEGDGPARLDDPAWPILTTGSRRQPARFAATARLDRALVAAGSEVAGEVTRSVLAPGVRVEPGAIVRDAVLLHDVVVRAGAHVERAIVDEGVDVGRDARVGDASAAGDGDSIVVVGRGARIAPGSRHAAGARLDPTGSSEGEQARDARRSRALER